MIAPDGYRLEKPARVTADSELCRAVRASDGRSVLLKVCSDSPTLVRERRMIDRLHGRNLPTVVDLDASVHPPVLVLQDPTAADLADFVPLPELLGDRSPDLRVFLDVALQLTEALGDIHQSHLIHRSLEPGVAFVRPADMKLVLVDFSLAGEVGQALPRSLERTHGYFAPEQTGRLDEGEDTRTDLYLLGLTLYFCLLGRPPFEGDDEDDLVVSHVSIAPPPPRDLRGDTPDAVSRLISKLLEKEPAARYQTARAVHHDLRTIRELLASRPEALDDLELARTDSLERPLFERRLFGRDAEIEVLVEAFGRTSAGARELWLLSGPHGIGKAAVVRELRPAVLDHNGYLCVGKFDRYRRDVPYHGWRGAFDGLVQQILMQSDSGLARWRSVIGEALGNLCPVMVEFLPDLALVLGPQPPPSSVGPREASARLLLTIQRFVRAIATAEHPLAIALHDLQWADGGSRRVLEEILHGDRPDGLLVIGTYRDGDDRAHAAIAATARRLEERGVTVHAMELAPLSDLACQCMIAEALSRPVTEVRELSDQVSRKTGNNPLLVQQFLTLLHEREILVHRPETGWRWDLEELAAADIPDDALGMMTAKLRAVDADGRDILNLASCLGSPFTAEQLAALGHRSPEAIQEALRTQVQAGLIAPCRDGLRFAHDGIREAALALVPAEDLAQRHYQIAQQMMSSPDGLDRARLFALADHVSAAEAVFPKSESQAAAALTLDAAVAANEAGAFTAAERYLGTTRTLIDRSGELLDDAREVRIIVTSSDAAVQAGDFEAALRYLDEVDAETLPPLLYAQIAGRRCQIFTLSQGPEKGARHLLHCLRHLGVRWPLAPSRWRIFVENLRTEWAMRNKESGARLEPARDLGEIWAPSALLALGGGALRIDIYLLFLASCYSLRAFVKHGYIVPPAYTLAAHAANGFAIFRDRAGATAYARVARDWIGAPRALYRHRAEFLLRTGVDCSLSPRREAVEPLRRIRETSFESGDIEFALHAASYASVIRALTGDPIDEVTAELQSLAAKIERLGHRYPDVKAILEAYRLLSPCAPFEGTQPPSLESDLEESRHLYAGDRNAEVRVSTIWMLVLAVYDRFDLVWRETNAIGRRLARVSPIVHSPDHTLLAGLAAAAMARRARGLARSKLVRAARRARSRLERWALDSPDCGPMRLLLAAELESLRRPGERALGAFDRADSACQEAGHLHYAALAQERAGAMLTSYPCHARSAGVSFGRAAALYAEWGASAKAQILRRRSQR